MQLALCIFAVALCFQVVSSSTPSDLVVTVALMTPSDPQYNNPLRISSGYVVNGIQGAALTLTAGKTYRFNITNTCAHPFYFTDDQNGGGTDFPYGSLNYVPGPANGIAIFDPQGNQLPNNASSYLQACLGAVVQYTPPLSFINRTHYYQCGYHVGMGWQISIVQETFCEKYAAALNVSELTLMNVSISAIIGNIVASPILLDFFDGANAALTSPPCCQIDFTTNLAQYNRLAGLLIGFFGGFLGCNDPGFPAYTGSTDLQSIHALMPIGTIEFNTFNSIVISTLTGLGVAPADLVPLYTFLNSTKDQICNGADCRTSFCDRYADLLHLPGYTLVYTVVQGTVGLVAVDTNSPIRHYFNCTPTFPSCFDYLAGTTASNTQLGILEDHLTTFFGQRGILGCTTNGTAAFPAYDGNPNISAVHQPMGISGSDFDFFNQALISVLAGAGVTQNDQSFVLSILETTRPLIVSQTLVAPPPTVDETINFIVSTKNSSQPFNGLGYPSGFYADQPVVLQYGKRYQFNYQGTCAHPLYLTTNHDGEGLDEFSTSITSSDYSLVCSTTQGGSGSFIVYVDSLFCAAYTAPLYYDCRIHQAMGGPVTVNGCPSAPSPSPSGTPPAASTGTPSSTGSSPPSSSTGSSPPPSTSSGFYVFSSLSLLLALLVLFI